MTDPLALSETIQAESAFLRDVQTSLGQVLVGQEPMVRGLLLGMLADGHVLLEGLPGLAKSLAVSSLATVVGGRFQRLQFTPDLLPADVIGTHVYNPKSGEWDVKEGPLFANIVLADEINRAPAKVQSALLEAMQERHGHASATRPPPLPDAVLRSRDAEPGRAGGDIPAARGAGRPLHAEAAGSATPRGATRSGRSSTAWRPLTRAPSTRCGPRSSLERILLARPRRLPIGSIVDAKILSTTSSISCTATREPVEVRGSRIIEHA